MVMLDYVDKGIAEGYRDFFSDLAQTHSKCWWIVCLAEWECRHEWAIGERRRQKEFHSLVPIHSQYNDDRPWNSVLRAAFEGTEAIQYWKRTVEDKAKRWQDRGGRGVQADVLQLQGEVLRACRPATRRRYKTSLGQGSGHRSGQRRQQQARCRSTEQRQELQHWAGHPEARAQLARTGRAPSGGTNAVQMAAICIARPRCSCATRSTATTTVAAWYARPRRSGTISASGADSRTERLDVQ